MDIDFFAQSLADICAHSLVSPGRPLDCTIIVNPVAGGFAMRSRWKSHSMVLNECRDKAKANPQRTLHRDVNLILTDGKGSGGEITTLLIEKAKKEPAPFYLIISAGGDGTHSEVMFALYNAPAHVRSNIAVLRLPLGTGNDGACSHFLSQALELLIRPVHVEFAPAVQLIPSHSGQAVSKGPFLAFNILSFGLDAFVTHMTNKMKGKVPGDSYKMWVDVAALFYDRMYKVDIMDIRALDEQNMEICRFSEKALLLAMGASGGRTYGSQERILPDSRNVCFMRQMPLARKLAIKGQVTKGTHADSAEVELFRAHRVEFSGSHPILAQMDGESLLLRPEDFPAALELTAPVIPLLKESGGKTS